MIRQAMTAWRRSAVWCWNPASGLEHPPAQRIPSQQLLRRLDIGHRQGGEQEPFQALPVRRRRDPARAPPTVSATGCRLGSRAAPESSGSRSAVPTRADPRTLRSSICRRPNSFRSSPLFPAAFARVFRHPILLRRNSTSVVARRVRKNRSTTLTRTPSRDRRRSPEVPRSSDTSSSFSAWPPVPAVQLRPQHPQRQPRLTHHQRRVQMQSPRRRSRLVAPDHPQSLTPAVPREVQIAPVLDAQHRPLPLHPLRCWTPSPPRLPAGLP